MQMRAPSFERIDPAAMPSRVRGTLTTTLSSMLASCPPTFTRLAVLAPLERATDEVDGRSDGRVIGWWAADDAVGRWIVRGGKWSAGRP